MAFQILALVEGATLRELKYFEMAYTAIKGHTKI